MATELQPPESVDTPQAHRPGLRRANAPSQLSVDELQQCKWLLGGLLILFSMSTVVHMELGATTLMLVAAAAVFGATVQPRLPARVPRLAHRLAFSFVAAFFTLDLWATGELLSAIVRLDLLLLLYRGIAYRKRRDDLQLVVLGLFLVVLGGVLSVSLAFVLQLLAFAALALVFLLLVTLSAGPNRPAAPPTPHPGGEGVPTWARQVRWGRLLARVRQVTDWRVVVLGGTLFVGLVAVSALLFLAIPRFQLENSFFLERFVTRKTLTGFSDTIRFGEVTDITQDNRVALNVDVSDPTRIPADPYWRMIILDDYRDATFRLSPPLRRAALGLERGGMIVRGNPSDEPARPQDVFWTFYFEAGVSRFLPLLGRFGSLQFREPQNFRFSRNLSVLELRAEPATMLAYRVTGMQESDVIDDPAFAERWRALAGEPAAESTLYLRTGLNEQDRALLREVLAEILGDVESSSARTVARANVTTAEFNRRAREWLTQRHGYSLSPRIPSGPGDPVVRWLTSREAGHCELFAGSLVLLARTAGLPARVATGFRGGSWNAYSNNFTLRNSDAHAWCEIFDAASGAWLRADPTPGGPGTTNAQGEDDAAREFRTDRSWMARLDSLRVFWYRRIVSFDQQSQRQTLDAVKTATERSGRWLRATLMQWTDAVRLWWTRPWSGARVTVYGVAIIVILVAAWSLRAWGGWRGWRWRLQLGHKRGDAVRNEAGRWLARLPRDVDPQLRRDLQRLRYGARATWHDVPGVFRRARRAWRSGKRSRHRT